MCDRTEWVEEDADFVTALCWGGCWSDDQGQADLPRTITHLFYTTYFFPLKTLIQPSSNLVGLRTHNSCIVMYKSGAKLTPSGLLWVSECHLVAHTTEVVA